MVNQKKAFQFAGLIVKHAQPIPVCMEQVLLIQVILLNITIWIRIKVQSSLCLSSVVSSNNQKMYKYFLFCRFVSYKNGTFITYYNMDQVNCIGSKKQVILMHMICIHHGLGYFNAIYKK